MCIPLPGFETYRSPHRHGVFVEQWGIRNRSGPLGTAPPGARFTGVLPRGSLVLIDRSGSGQARGPAGAGPLATGSTVGGYHPAAGFFRPLAT